MIAVIELLAGLSYQGYQEESGIAFGFELITDPKLIVLDEPTSGLDSTTAYRIIKLLRKEARLRECCVICTIHQPSAETLSLFDKVICLNEGVTIYNGRTDKISNYFKDKFNVTIKKFTNPADFLLNLAHHPEHYREGLTV